MNREILIYGLKLCKGGAAFGLFALWLVTVFFSFPVTRNL